MFVLFSISVRFYSSIYFIRFSMNIFRDSSSLVGSSGLEPPTSRLSGARSNHLSYEPIKVFRCISSLSPLVEMMGFEPMTPCLQGRCSPNWATPPCCFMGFLLWFPFRSLKIEQQASHTSHLYLTWPLVCRDFALLKTTKSRKLCLQISCSP